MALTLLTTAIVMCLACARTALRAAGEARNLREATIIATAALETTAARQGLAQGYSGAFAYVVQTQSRTAPGAANAASLCDRTVTVTRLGMRRSLRLATTSLCLDDPPRIAATR